MTSRALDQPFCGTASVMVVHSQRCLLMSAKSEYHTYFTFCEVDLER
jgi:hypothetical protein